MVALNFAYVDEATKMLSVVVPIVDKNKAEKHKSSSNGLKSGQKKIRKLTKDLIGTPSNFQHVAHMGPSQKQTMAQVKVANKNGVKPQPRRPPPRPPLPRIPTEAPSPRPPGSVTSRPQLSAKPAFAQVIAFQS